MIYPDGEYAVVQDFEPITGQDTDKPQADDTAATFYNSTCSTTMISEDRNNDCPDGVCTTSWRPEN